MAFLIVFFIVALSLCVIGLVVISLWWSSLFVAAIFGSVRGDWKSNRLHASSQVSEARWTFWRRQRSFERARTSFIASLPREGRVMR
jgi:hypothetical protein